MRDNCNLKKWILPVSAFGVSAILLCGVFAVSGLYPFGERTLAWGDMSQQVVPLLMELKDILSGNSSMFLNLQNAGGMSFWGVFFFFLSSPFHLLVVLIEKAEIYHLVNILVLVKLSLAAATASVFFRREAPSLPFSAQLALSLSYGLCGYGMLYYQNLVWLDMLYLFPILVIGFLRVIEEGKIGLFTATLTIAIATNYYLSYMVFLELILCSGIFLWVCVPPEKRGVTAGKLGAGALTALLLTAVIWLPSLLQCLSSARTSGGVADSIRSGGFWAMISTTLPVLFCSASAAVLPWLYRPSPPSPKGRAVAICWGLTVLPMLVEPINKMWHTGSYQAFPARYGYMPVLFGLWFMAIGLRTQRKKGKPLSSQAKFALAISVSLSLAAGAYLLTGAYKTVSEYTHTLWVSPQAFGLLTLFWLTCLSGVFLVCSLWRKAGGKFLSKVLLAFCLVQSVVQAEIWIGSAANVPEKSLAVLATAGPEDMGLYRVKPESKFCHVNLLGGLGFPTLSHYTSLTDERFLAVMKKLGYSSYWMEISGCCGTTVSDILLSNKYSLNEEVHYSLTGAGNLGYLVPAETLPETLVLGDRIALQNELSRILTGAPAFESHMPINRTLRWESDRILLEPGVLQYEISVEKQTTLYFDAFDCISTRLREKINEVFSVTVNGVEVTESYPTQSCNGILNLGTFEQEMVHVQIEIKRQAELCSFGVWSMDFSQAAALRGALTNGELCYENNEITGKIHSNSGQALFLSIPWNPGMRVLVNGGQVQPRIVLDCFMEIPLANGENDIMLLYIPVGFLPGLYISIGGMVILSICWVLQRKKWLHWLTIRWYQIAPALLYTAFVLLLLAVYVLPLLIWITG